MIILVINCGSSSVKYELIHAEHEEILCGGVVERIGEEHSSHHHKVSGKDKVHRHVSSPHHHSAIEIIRDILVHAEEGVIKDVSEVTGVGHRTVHGGEDYSSSTLITDEVLKSIQKFEELAPLHNPPSLEGIRACIKIFKDVPQVAVFDTAFHQTMPKHAFCYGIPYEFYLKFGIRKYGFHGTSHRYVSGKAAEVLERPIEDLNIITVHLGNGCSVAAVKGGKSMDTSMGLTPLEGLVMGTRSGDIDPAVVTFLTGMKHLSAEQVVDILNKKSGLLGISGLSNDMRDILRAIKGGDERAKLAYDVFVYRIKKYIGSYAAVLGTVDAVVFTAGIGENVPQIKESIRSDLRPLLGDGTEFLTISTNEELLIAKDTFKIVSETVNK